MKHQLNFDNLQAFESKTQIAGSFGNGENKSLNIISKITEQGEIQSYFSVVDHKVEKIQTPFLDDAITIYNEL